MATATKERKTTGITLATSTLRAALADVLRAVPTRHAKPILANVRLGDGLLTGTDLEKVINTVLKAGSPIEYLDAPEFQTYWDSDAKVLDRIVRKIGRVE